MASSTLLLAIKQGKPTRSDYRTPSLVIPQASLTRAALTRSEDSDIVDVPGKLQIDTLATAGSQQLCLNSSSRVAPCSSSLRYKSGVQQFAAGLEIINRLRPITFTWKEGGMRDIGLAA